jgi:DNA-directed RNA polymerase specialized sigma subunit
VTTPRAQLDLETWRRWKEDPGPETVGPLLERLQPIVRSAIGGIRGAGGGQASMRLPPVVIEGMATNMSLDWLARNYDPAKGSQINTYLTDHLKQKMYDRLNVYQNVVRIPHGKAEYIGKIKETAADLEEELRRPPNDEEIAARLGLSPAHIAEIRGQAAEKDWLASAAPMESAAQGPSPMQRAMRQTYIELSPQDRAVYDLWIKQNNTNQNIMQMMNMSRRELERVQKRIQQNFAENHAMTG